MKYLRIYRILIICALFQSSYVAGQDLTSGLVSVWEFDEATGTTAVDSHGNIDGTIDGPITLNQLGIIGPSFGFVGSNTHSVEVPTGVFHEKSALTISTWIKASDLNWQQGIVSSYRSPDRTILLRTNDNTLQFYTYSSTNGQVGGSYTTINVGQWYHIVAIYDGSSMTLYVNGVLDDTSFSQNGPLGENSDVIGYIGNYKNSSQDNRSWNGNIDQVAIWDRALNSSEVDMLYNSGSGLAYSQWAPPPTPPDLTTGLIGYWPFNGNANDASGNVNDGIVNGATLTSDRDGNTNSAYSFDGVNQDINIAPTISQLSTTSSGSWSAWINVPSFAAFIEILSFANFTSYHNVSLYVADDGRISASVWDGTIPWEWYSTNSIPTNTWVHIAMVQDSAQPVFYLDGTQMSGNFTNQGDLTKWINGINGIDRANIGSVLDGAYFNGAIDDVGIWDRALTEEEVQMLASGSSPTPTLPPDPPALCELIFCDGDHVGIGTTSPDELLTVNGTIHAKEVRVDLNVPGPDYVFEDNYDLKNLLEIEKYINENRHLPEIPSAKEMEESGVQLSQMNMLLLKKIEELTLHLIRQEKQIKELEIMYSKELEKKQSPSQK